MENSSASSKASSTDNSDAAAQYSVTATDNLNVYSQSTLLTPSTLKSAIPVSKAAEKTVVEGRQTIQNILDGKDSRLFVVVGPCSIHDVKAALEYAELFKTLAEAVKDKLYLVMRVYFEKPRTTLGWKGLINDPYLNDSFKIEEGLHIGRKLLLDLAEMGIPTATEALDPISPQYLQDLVSWSAIGARTTESQTHREMSSGLSCPVGFKNGTDGNLGVAINAMQSCSGSHRFLGVASDGRVSTIHTKGNPYSHIVLRGGSTGPNYDEESVNTCTDTLIKKKLRAKIMIDCSHANSNKDPALQTVVIKNVADQKQNGNTSICGLMVESHLNWGSQTIPKDLSELKYGVSITDACIDWETTEIALKDLAAAL